MKISEIYSLFTKCNGISTDTRNITTNSMFFALKGTQFDANNFAFQALENGANYAVVDSEKFKKTENNRLIFVEDSLKCLQELAAFHRFHIGLPILALTGSNGKTTTKELLYAVLSKHYNTVATLGNLNNHIGVPLTLLRLTEETDLGIIEMGANHQKEIELLCEITQPDFGLVTNFGRAHLEGFGGIEGVIQAKSELYDYLNHHRKTVFINYDDPIQVKKTEQTKRFGFSIEQNDEAPVQIHKAYAQPMATLEVNNTMISSNLTGLYNCTNLAFAVSVGMFFNIPITTIKEAIENYIPRNNRSQWVDKGSQRILLDAYNANPSSMEVAIDNFVQLEGNTKAMILGDMFELGNETEQEHKKIILKAQQTKGQTYFIGKYFFEQQIPSANAFYFQTLKEFLNYLKTKPLNQNIMLIKGSRGMALEQILEYL